MKYRSDIDGLRALAVLSVVLYHAGVPYFSGGFVGVDVFFVISGYLITRILHEQVQSNGLSLVNFYERRIRRIFPALFVVLFSSWAAAYFLMTPVDLLNFNKSFLAAGLSVSNVFFWLDSGYFNNDAQLKPLLHTWSLGVEEQFYIFFPLLLLLAHRLAKPLLAVFIGVLFLISLVLSVIYIDTSPDAVFYLLPHRAWELLAGSLLAIVSLPVLRNSCSNTLLAFTGLLLIIWPVLAYSEETQFPGLAALLPVAGTFLIIYTGKSETAIHRFLALKPLVFTGLISYSLYLWHWPFIVFSRYYSASPLSTAQLLFLMSAMFIVSAISWRYIEQPFRGREIVSSRKLVFVMSGITVMAAIFLGYAGITSNGFPERLDDTQQKYAGMQAKEQYYSLYDRGNCFMDLNQIVKNYKFIECVKFNVQDKKLKKILIYGDSFAAHLYPGFKHLEESNLAVRQFTAASCRPIQSGKKRCDDFYHAFFDNVIKATDADVIVISALWNSDYRRLQHEEFVKRLESTLEWLSRFKKQIIVVGQSPIYFKNIPHIMITQNSPMDGKVILPARDYQALNNTLSETVSRYTYARFINPYTVACNDDGCLAAENGDPYHMDYGHMTQKGSVFYAREISKMIDAAD